MAHKITENHPSLVDVPTWHNATVDQAQKDRESGKIEKKQETYVSEGTVDRAKQDYAEASKEKEIDKTLVPGSPGFAVAKNFFSGLIKSGSSSSSKNKNTSKPNTTSSSSSSSSSGSMTQKQSNIITSPSSSSSSNNSSGYPRKFSVLSATGGISGESSGSIPIITSTSMPILSASSSSPLDLDRDEEENQEQSVFAGSASSNTRGSLSLVNKQISIASSSSSLEDPAPTISSAMITQSASSSGSSIVSSTFSIAFESSSSITTLSSSSSSSDLFSTGNSILLSSSSTSTSLTTTSFPLFDESSISSLSSASSSSDSMLPPVVSSSLSSSSSSALSSIPEVETKKEEVKEVKREDLPNKDIIIEDASGQPNISSQTTQTVIDVPESRKKTHKKKEEDPPYNPLNPYVIPENGSCHAFIACVIPYAGLLYPWHLINRIVQKIDRTEDLYEKLLYQRVRGTLRGYYLINMCTSSAFTTIGLIAKFAPIPEVIIPASIIWCAGNFFFWRLIHNNSLKIGNHKVALQALEKRALDLLSRISKISRWDRSSLMSGLALVLQRKKIRETDKPKYPDLQFLLSSKKLEETVSKLEEEWDRVEKIKKRIGDLLAFVGRIRRPKEESSTFPGFSRISSLAQQLRDKKDFRQKGPLVEQLQLALNLHFNNNSELNGLLEPIKGIKTPAELRQSTPPQRTIEPLQEAEPPEDDDAPDEFVEKKVD